MKSIVAHGGGPTAVLNASLAGVIDTCREQPIRCMAPVSDWEESSAMTWWTCSAVPPEIAPLQRKRLAPSSDRADAPLRTPIMSVCSTCCAGATFMSFSIPGAMGRWTPPCRFHVTPAMHITNFSAIGIPKTIDNDLLVTDHAPGYASTAHFFACAARDAGVDNRSLRSPVCVLETLGRNTGWIVAATALRAGYPDDAPHLIYFPERHLSLDRIAADVESVYQRLGRVVIAVCEGQLDANGAPFGADVDRRAARFINSHRISATLWRGCSRRRPGCALEPKNRA